MSDFSRRDFINCTAKILTGAAVFGFFPESGEAKRKAKENSTKVVERGYKPVQNAAEEILPEEPEIFVEETFPAKNSVDNIPIMPSNLRFVQKMQRRTHTGGIVIHHAGTTRDMDLETRTIHRWHIDRGWAGIGYHYVIHKDGTIEGGRPSEFIGAHCKRHNNYTVGVCVIGNFDLAEPTDAQFLATEQIIAAIGRQYGFKPSFGRTVFGHRDLGRTACPGNYLYRSLPEIVRGANIYF